MRRHGFGRALVAGALAVLLTLESGLTSYAAETALTGGDGAAADEAVTDGQDAADEAVADEAAANETVEDGAITDEFSWRSTSVFFRESLI